MKNLDNIKFTNRAHSNVTFVDLDGLGIGEIETMSANKDKLIITVKLDDGAYDELLAVGKNDVEKNEETIVQNLKITTDDMKPAYGEHVMTKEEIFDILSFHPLVHWADGKKGYKLYLEGLTAKKLYVRDIEKLSEPDQTIVKNILETSRRQSAPILEKIYDLLHELSHLKNPYFKPSVEEESEK